MKKNVLYVFMICMVSGVSLSAMEGDPRESKSSRETIAFKELPYELNVYMTPLMGDTINETINNIISLSQVDKYFNGLIKSNFDAISRMLKKRFYKNINNTFYAAMETKNYKNIASLLKFNVISLEEVIEAAAVEEDDILIHYLYARNLIDNDPSLIVGDELLTPIGFIINSLDYARTDSLILAMMVNGADINDYDGNITTLYAVLMHDDYYLFWDLLRLGADPLKPNKDGTSILEYLKNNPGKDYHQSMRFLSYKDLIRNEGYEIPEKYAVYIRRGHLRSASLAGKTMRQGCFKRVM